MLVVVVLVVLVVGGCVVNGGSGFSVSGASRKGDGFILG